MAASLLYNTCYVPQLKEILRERQLPIGGRKSELVERLQLSDLSVSELKIKLKRVGLSDHGSKLDLVRRMQKEKGKGNYVYIIISRD